MAQARKNAEEARSVLRDAITHGAYARGMTLPSTRDLAAQFGINRNTAAKIYQELAQDRLIELGTNRPPIVIGGGTPESGDLLHGRLLDALRPLLHESLLIGIPPEKTRQVLASITDEFFANHRSLKVYFAECNDFEAQVYAQNLTQRLGSAVRPILLDQLAQVESSDIVVTPYFHLQEAAEKLDGGTSHLVGLVVTADSSEIANIAAMVTTGPLGIIAVNLSAAERLRRLLGFQIDVPMMTAAIDRQDTLEAMHGVVECVVCTARVDRMDWQRIPDVPSALVHYHADEHSIENLRGEIQRLSQTGLAMPPADDG